MKTPKIGILILALSTLLVLLGSTNAFADTWQGMYIHNGTGQTAND
jgi:hypothetical protein